MARARIAKRAAERGLLDPQVRLEDRVANGVRAGGPISVQFVRRGRVQGVLHRTARSRCTLVVDIGRGLEYCGDIGSIAIVIPCFDEADRLDIAALRGGDRGTAGVVLRVRRRRLDRFDGRAPRTPPGSSAGAGCGASALPPMRARGRQCARGMREALDEGAELVAYADADLSTHFARAARLLDRLRARRALTAVLGSRFSCLGADIRRSELRH